MAFRRTALRAAFACAASAVALATVAPGADSQSRHHVPVARDALEARTLDQLHDFTAWLRRGHARGYIGEVGWPGNPAAGGDERFNALARAWYARARAARLWVTAWAAGDFWQPSYKLLAYSTADLPRLLPNPQAAVVELQKGYPQLRGVNVAGAEFGDTPVDQATSTFSNQAPGTYGTDYTYPEASSLRQLAQRGVRLVRLPVRWERVQPAPGGALDPDEVARLRATLAASGDAGLQVILDVHNYGAYYLARDGQGVRTAIGSPGLPVADFADLWRRLARALGDQRALAGYGLMNEPTGMAGPRTWERASRAAVRAIRATGDGHRVFVGGYDWSSVRNFPRNHPRGPWIRDRRVVYEAHQYFDDDNTGRYLLGYDAEVARARAEGYGDAAAS